MILNEGLRTLGDDKIIRTGTIRVDGVLYTLTYDPTVPGYHVTDHGREVVTVIGKRISEAKRYVREYIGEDVSR